eukprot:COSAG01_NODE_7150_length_3329_cov_2.649845_1_plen_32_part_10
MLCALCCSVLLCYALLVTGQGSMAGGGGGGGG